MIVNMSFDFLFLFIFFFQHKHDLKNRKYDLFVVH